MLYYQCLFEKEHMALKCRQAVHFMWIGIKLFWMTSKTVEEKHHVCEQTVMEFVEFSKNILVDSKSHQTVIPKLTKNAVYFGEIY